MVTLPEVRSIDHVTLGDVTQALPAPTANGVMLAGGVVRFLTSPSESRTPCSLV